MFSNKVAIITGASSGIGAAAAILFAKEGANVAMVGRNMSKLNKVAAEVAKVGKKPLVITADLAEDKDVKKIVQEAVKTFGRIDVLVNNAGFAKHCKIVDPKVMESYDETMNVNIRAVVLLTSLAGPHIIASKGNIINISSTASTAPPGDSSYMAYYVSKAALDHFTRCAAVEFATQGVRVNGINPGPVKSDFFDNAGMKINWDEFGKMTALNRVSKPEELAELILYVAGDKAQGITGSCIVADNGYLLKN